MIAAFAAVLVGILSAAHGSMAIAGSNSPLRVVTTTGMIADAAREVGGKHVDVRALMGAGVDPHAYRLTRTDILALTRADLILSHGLFLEAQMEDALARIGRRVKVVAVAERLPESVLRPHDVYSGKFDPHVWMAPKLWTSVVRAVWDILVEMRPDSRSAFDNNAANYIRQIEALDAYAKKVLASVPKDRRLLVTAHDAFGYFGAAYGYDVHGIQGISTDSEAGLNRIRELADLLVDRKVPAVFIESSVSARSVEALVEGAAARGHRVTIGGELFSDAMGAEGSYEGTYIGMIDHNVTIIARALGGEAPSGGFAGRLALAQKGSEQ